VCKIHRKNDFVEVFKNVIRYIKSENDFWDHQNNYIGISSMMNNTSKNVDILAINLRPT